MTEGTAFKDQLVHRDPSVCVERRDTLESSPERRVRKECPEWRGTKERKDKLGRRAKTGEKGHKGAVGPSGRMGLPGPKGDFRGEKGDRGFSGQKGSKGDAGSSGVTYVRWVALCALREPALCTLEWQLVRHGMRKEEQVTLFVWQVTHSTRVEMGLVHLQLNYQELDITQVALPQHHCVIAIPTTFPVSCHTTTKSTLFMLPGRYTCPSEWHTEYSGYIMTEWTGGNRPGRRDTICVDQDAEATNVRRSRDEEAWNFFMTVTCFGLDCPPFDSQKPLTCAVCSK